MGQTQRAVVEGTGQQGGGYCWPGDRPPGNTPNNTLNGQVCLAGVFPGLFSGEEAQVPRGAAAIGGYCSARYTTLYSWPSRNIDTLKYIDVLLVTGKNQTNLSHQSIFFKFSENC